MNKKEVNLLLQVNTMSTSEMYEFVHHLHRINYTENTAPGIAMSVFHIIKTDIIISICSQTFAMNLNVLDQAM